MAGKILRVQYDPPAADHSGASLVKAVEIYYVTVTELVGFTEPRLVCTRCDREVFPQNTSFGLTQTQRGTQTSYVIEDRSAVDLERVLSNARILGFPGLRILQIQGL